MVMSAFDVPRGKFLTQWLICIVAALSEMSQLSGQTSKAKEVRGRVSEMMNFLLESSCSLMIPPPSTQMYGADVNTTS